MNDIPSEGELPRRVLAVERRGEAGKIVLERWRARVPPSGLCPRYSLVKSDDLQL